jgi:hypothetical protein
MVEADDNTEAKDIGEADDNMEAKDIGEADGNMEDNDTKESEEEESVPYATRDMVEEVIVEAGSTEETNDKANDDSSLTWDYFDLS